jgi:hypothetical protein
METIKKLIESGEITLDDIEEYLNSIGKSVEDTARLEMLEDSFMNHPG